MNKPVAKDLDSPAVLRIKSVHFTFLSSEYLALKKAYF